MKRRIVYLMFLIMLSGTIFASGPKIGAIVFQENFNTPKNRDLWSKNKSVQFIEKIPGNSADQCVYVEIPKSINEGSASIGIKLDPAELRGCVLRMSARIKSEDVAKPPASYNGIDVQLHIKSPTQEIWHQSGNQFGTSDWRTITCDVSVPNDAQLMDLGLGLEKTNGKVWIDDLEIKVVNKKRARPVRGALDENGNLKPVYTGHQVQRLRGAMIQPHRFGPEDIKVFADQWKANHVRWQMNWGFPNGRADTATVEEFDRWIDSECALLDKMLPYCEKYGVAVCLDLHTSPGGRDKNHNARMFQHKEYQDAFINTWIKLAKKYKDSSAIWGYDLLNEPCETAIPEGQGILNWHDLVEKTAQEVRKIDPVKPVIIEPAPWGGPDPLDWFEPIKATNVVYSVHMYIPHAFTHQGVHDSKIGYVYPGKIGNVYWDKEKLRNALRPALEFQQDYGVQIYIGEFSAIRWAPDGSAVRYLKDVIDLFEEYGWDWAYHAFREWSGWSVEHGTDPANDKKADSPTDRELLLRSWFEKNERPFKNQIEQK